MTSDENKNITIPHEDKQTPDEPPNGGLSAVLGWLWRLLSSVKLAIILILIITGLSLIGAFLVQVPKEMVGNAQAYDSWVQTVATQKIGAWAPLFSLLQLFDVFHSIWFKAAGILLMLNIVFCSINRWKNIKMSLQGGAVKRPESFFTAGNQDTQKEMASVPVANIEAAHLSITSLHARGYRTRIESDGDNVYIAADKNRYFRLGTYASHLSIILLVLAFVFGSLLGWSNSGFTVSEGATEEVGHNTNLSLRLNSFVAEFYDNGMPKDYRSEVTLYENGQQVRTALIRVNHPLIYKGIRFYQASYGSDITVQITVTQIDTATNTVHTIYDGSVYLWPMGNGMDSGYVVGSFDLIEQGYTIYVVSPTNADDPNIPSGNLMIMTSKGDSIGESDLITKDTPKEIAGLEFTVSGETSSKYSVFQVSRDPTNALIWIASGLFVLGISLVLYFPYKQIWVLSQRQGEQSSRLLIRTIASRGLNNSDELEALTKDVLQQLSAQNRGKER